MILTGRASSLAYLEHCMTFRAEAELVSASGDIMAEHKIEAFGPMTTTAGTNALVGVPVKEQRVAFVAEPPASLEARPLGEIEAQLHPRGAAAVGSPCSAPAFVIVARTIEEDRAAFRA